MTPTEANKLLISIEGYYKREITSNPIVCAVWLKLFLPLTVNEGTEMAMYCIEKHEWLPSPKTLREEFLQSHGTDFKRELREAIAAYSSADIRQIRSVPNEIASAIVQAGGANKFRHATEEQWAKLEREYISFRSKAQQQIGLVALAGGVTPKGLEANHESR